MLVSIVALICHRHLPQHSFLCVILLSDIFLEQITVGTAKQDNLYYCPEYVNCYKSGLCAFLCCYFAPKTALGVEKLNLYLVLHGRIVFNPGFSGQNSECKWVDLILLR